MALENKTVKKTISFMEHESHGTTIRRVTEPEQIEDFAKFDDTGLNFINLNNDCSIIYYNLEYTYIIVINMKRSNYNLGPGIATYPPLRSGMVFSLRRVT